MSFSLKNTLGELLEVRKKKHDYEALHIPAASSLNIIHLILPPLSGRRLAVPAVDKDSLLSRNLHSVLPRITLEHYSLPSIFTWLIQTAALLITDRRESLVNKRLISARTSSTGWNEQNEIYFSGFDIDSSNRDRVWVMSLHGRQLPKYKK